MSEKNLDFDTVIDRKNTNSLKYDFAQQRKRPADAMPLWVADMDFKTSSYVQEAIIEQASHGIYGYSEAQDGYFEALAGWFLRHHDWEVRQEWLTKTPGVVFALAAAVRAFTEEGDSVLIQQPVYYPFREVIEDNGRRLISSPLCQDKDGIYRMDVSDFEEKVIKEQVKVFLLCNPHNPVGRVWTKEELEQIGDICLRHHVIVVSDEIHADFAFARAHQVFAGVRPEYEDITVTCTSPSKTFNLAGLQVSNIFIANPGLRKRFQKEVAAAGYSQLNAVGLAACEAAYRHGDEWYDGVCAYLKANIVWLEQALESRIPEITFQRPEGTYLVWLDCSRLGLNEEELENFMLYRAKLWLDGGNIFGKIGNGYQRINVACPRSILEQAVLQLEEAVKELRGEQR
jgi:cystathionine beta-lyase